mgnify:CR=1 FL=1|tara:strand:- start:5434 stop:6288 length:855 start_codon:yes stop_codon:yes gene_type:complete
MMLAANKDSLDYLYDFKDGKIKQGLKIGCLLDDNFVYKQGDFNMFLGLDNVGKTNWIIWYLTALSLKHEKKWCIWSGENRAGQLKRDIIQYISGTSVKELTKKEILKYHDLISNYFTFIDNRKMYSHKDILKIFKDVECDGGLIDPFTGLNHDRRVNQFDRNYHICNDVREFCNKTKKSIFISIHPQTEAARRVYPPKHIHEGHIQPPRKADCEGGQVFPNRVDNFICIHRMITNPVLWMQTEIHVYKIKDKETGGSPTALGEPLRFDWNHGLGFTIGGQNALK